MYKKFLLIMSLSSVMAVAQAKKESFNYELLDNLFKEVLEEENIGFNEK